MIGAAQDCLLVTLWGARGSIATPGLDTAHYGGNTACVEVCYREQRIILDAGTGIRELGKQIPATDGHNEFHLFLSHTHWDHIQGFPFFLPAYNPANTIHFYGSHNKEAKLEKILTGQMHQSYFPVQMQDLPAQMYFHELTDQPLIIGDLQIQAQEQVYHPGGSLRFRVSAGKATVVYASDVEIDGICEAAPNTPEARQFAAYCRFIANADLLIADAQYTREDYATRKGWGHSSFETVIETATRAGVKHLAMFHHDPDNTDNIINEFEQYYASTAPDIAVFWAREGTTIPLA